MCPCVSDIQREEEKVKRSIKDAAKKGQKDVCVILAKEMIQSKRAVSKLYASKAHMNSVQLSMKNQLCEFGNAADGSLDWEENGFNVTHVKSLNVISTTICSLSLEHNVCQWRERICVSLAVLRVAGALQKSTEVMKAMQSLIKVPEIQATMRELSKEMMKVSSSDQHI